jgi:sortase A
MLDKKNGKKKIVTLIFCISLIGFGLWFSTTNAYKFLKGYFIYKKDYAAEESVEKSNHESKEKSSREQSLYPIPPKKGEMIGNLIIPKLDVTLPIYHGTDEDELERGVGHFAGSVLPGENDNSVLAGHRDTVFRRLGEVGVNDLLIVETSAGRFTYKVRKVRIVDQNDRTVIVPKPKATLTLSTCYPFDFVGSAPERYVLVADLKEKKLTNSESAK